MSVTVSEEELRAEVRERGWLRVVNHHRLTHSTWEEGEGEGGRERSSNRHYTFPSLKVHMYVHTYNVLNDCMLTFAPAKTMFLAGEEREVALSTY